jgi:uncharacterized protein YdeI (YjbR/CyaY-like superfamily)
MTKIDNGVEAYIAKAKPFAKPILAHLRKLIHKAEPEIEETLKWGFPHFIHKGIVCSMASFKEHAAFGFWKAPLMKDTKRILSTAGKTSMGHFGQIKSIKDLPSASVIISYIKEAVGLNKNGVKLQSKPQEQKRAVEISDDFSNALKKNKKADKNFKKFSPSHKREYTEWVTEAKTKETRNNRIQTAIQRISANKPRNWKYMKK